MVTTVPAILAALFVLLSLVDSATAAAATHGSCAAPHINGSPLRKDEDPNLFNIAAFSQIAEPVLQKSALNVLTKFRGDELDRQLAETARSKIQHYANVILNHEVENKLQKQTSAKSGKDALEFVVQTFKNRDNGDGALRIPVIDMLGRHSESDVLTIETLLPVARGVNTTGFPDYERAAYAVANIAGRRKEIPDFYVTKRNFSRPSYPGALRDKLTDASVVSIKPISSGNNVNSTWVVTLRLQSGKEVRGVFKPLAGESTLHSGLEDRILFTREIQAYDFFTEHFAHPQIRVPETLEVVIRFKEKSHGVGSFQLFAEGATTVNDWYAPNGQRALNWSEYWKIWEAQRGDQRWALLAPWIQCFDWGLNNADRFPNSRYGAGNPNNIMMQESAGAGSPLIVDLIDNGNGRRWRPWGQYFDQDLPPLPNLSPELKKIVLTFDEPELDRIRARYRGSISAAGVDDLIHRLRTLRNHVLRSGAP